MKSDYLETLEKLQEALNMFDMSFSVSNKVFRLALVSEILDTACLFEQLYNSWSEHLPFGEGPDADVDFAYWKDLRTWDTLLNSAKQDACIDDYPVDMGNGMKSDMMQTNRRKNYLKAIGTVLRRSDFSGKEAASNFVKVINGDKTHMMTFGNMVFEALAPLLLILSQIDSLLENPNKSLYPDYFERQKNRFDEICEEIKIRIQGIIKENLSNRRKCNRLNALRDELWKNLYESKFLDALKDGINTYDIKDYHNDHPDIKKTEEEIRELLAIEELVDKNTIPDKEKTGQYIFNYRKTLSFEDISSFYVYLYAIPVIKVEIEKLSIEQRAENIHQSIQGEQQQEEKDSALTSIEDIIRRSLERLMQERITVKKNGKDVEEPLFILQNHWQDVYRILVDKKYCKDADFEGFDVFIKRVMPGEVNKPYTKESVKQISKTDYNIPFEKWKYDGETSGTRKVYDRMYAVAQRFKGILEDEGL